MGCCACVSSREGEILLRFLRTSRSPEAMSEISQASIIEVSIQELSVAIVNSGRERSAIRFLAIVAALADQFQVGRHRDGDLVALDSTGKSGS